MSQNQQGGMDTQSDSRSGEREPSEANDAGGELLVGLCATWPQLKSKRKKKNATAHSYVTLTGGAVLELVLTTSSKKTS